MLVLAYFKEVLGADIRIWKSGELIFNIRGVYILWGKNLVPVRRLVDLFHASVCLGKSYTQSPIYLWQLARCFPVSDASGQWCVSSWPCQLASGNLQRAMQCCWHLCLKNLEWAPPSPPVQLRT